jgi:hypothetical protein
MFEPGVTPSTSDRVVLSAAAVIVAVMFGLIVWAEGLRAATYEDPVVLAYLSIHDLDAGHGDSPADPCTLEDTP